MYWEWQPAKLSSGMCCGCSSTDTTVVSCPIQIGREMKTFMKKDISEFETKNEFCAQREPEPSLVGVPEMIYNTSYKKIDDYIDSLVS